MPTLDPEDPRAVALYDGVCKFCSGATQFILARDRRDRFRFAPLQGPFGQSVLARQGRPLDDLDTFYLVLDPGRPTQRVLTKSDAGLEVLRRLGGPYALAVIFRLVPRFVRDAVYDVIARNRYRWFGRLDACAVPRPEWRAKFID